jgi:phosphate/phosphite/phosphonate ABC transporter binding protein
MDGRPPSSTGILWGAARKALLCTLLAGVGVAAVLVAIRMLDSREPLADLSQRTVEVEPGTRSAREDGSLRFAVAAMVSVESTFSTYRSLVQRICRDVGQREAFVLRPSYAEVRQALEDGEVSVAFVCTGTYTRALSSKRIKLLVQPEFEKGRQYRSVLLVPARRSARKLEELRGGVMAFTDPESNTGRFVPTVMLAKRGWTPETFFRKVMFTGSHDRSIQAVASGIVDVAAVDSLIWESAKQRDPSLADRVKMIESSEPFGPPPVVVPVGLDPALEQSLQRAFLALDKDEEGRSILSAIGIKRFVLPRPEDYRTASELYRRFAEQERKK